MLLRQVHAGIKCAEEYAELLAAAFPCLPLDAVGEAATQLAVSPVAEGGVSTRCSKLSKGRRAGFYGFRVWVGVP